MFGTRKPTAELMAVYTAENVVFAYFATNEDLKSRPERLPLRELVNALAAGGK
jgi:hypothetical protein